MAVAKFCNGYISFTKIKDNVRIHVFFSKLIPNMDYIFNIIGCCISIELCNLKTNNKGELKYIFYDEIEFINKKINMYENNSLIDCAIIV